MYDWRKVILKQTDNMQTAIEVLNNESLQIVMVVDNNGCLVGTVTDGDIRRGLINHFPMDTQLSKIMYKKPTTASIGDSRSIILDKMKKLNLLQVPVLDKDRRIVDLELFQQLHEKSKFDNPIFLMAGGFGKRLRPLTNSIPKPMLKIGNKPILERILDQFVSSGFHNFYISTHYKAEVVKQHFGDGSDWGITIQYVHETKPLGTAGALGLLPRDLIDLPVLMMNGDLLTKIDFHQLLNFHIEQGGDATMCVREYDFQVPYGVIKASEQRITSIVEKPIHKFFVNAGVYVLNASIFSTVDGVNYIDMPHMLELNIEQGKQVNMFPIHEYWLDIGRKEQFKQAQYDSSELFY